MDLFFFHDLKKKLAMKELLERAKGGDEEAKAAIAEDFAVSDAFAQLSEPATGGARPKAKAKAEPKFSTRWLKPKAKAKADPKVSARSKEQDQGSDVGV